MGVKATYEVCCDLNDDGDFSDASEDITAYVKHYRTQHGASTPEEMMSRSATCDLTLNNASHLFSPEHASALANFTQGKRLRIRENYNGTWKLHYLGYIDHIKPAPGANERRETRVTCDGYFVRLQSDRAQLTPMTFVTTGTVISGLLKGVTQPIASSGAGKYGKSKYGAAVYGSPAVTAEAGAQSFPYVGDTIGPQDTIYGFSKQMVETERGFMFEDVDGTLKFWGRTHWSNDLQNAVDATFDGTYIRIGGGQYSYGEGIVNLQQLSFTPRRLDPALSVVAASAESVNLRHSGDTNGHDTKTVTLSFRDDQGQPCGAINIVPPVPGVDFRAHYYNVDVTKFVKVRVVPYSDRVDVIWTNTYTGPDIVYVYKNWQVRGQKLFTASPVTITSRDETSINTLRRTYAGPPLNLPLLQLSEDAQMVADAIVAQKKAPRGRFDGITFVANYDAAHMQQAHDRQIGDRIALSEGQTGANNEYWIVGITRDVQVAGDVQSVTYVLKPKPSSDVGIYGFSTYGAAKYA